MTNEASEVELSTHDLRVVARYAAEGAQEALSIFEEHHPGDRRPREAVEAAWTFAEGAKRTKLQRTSALAAQRLPRKRRLKPLGTRHAPPAMPQPRSTCTLSQDRPRSSTSWAPQHTQHALRSWLPAGIEALEHSESNRLANERRLRLLRCSGATPPPRRAETAWPNS
jgi:hypothetical protein